MSSTEFFTLPSEEEIAKLMEESGLGDMAEKTTFCETIGGQTRNILGVNAAWALAFSDYVKDLPAPVRITTTMLKPMFIKQLLALAGKENLFDVGVKAKLWSEK